MSRTIEGTSLLSEIVIQISDMDTPSSRLKALIRNGQGMTGDGFLLLGRVLKRVRSRATYPGFIDFPLVPLLG